MPEILALFQEKLTVKSLNGAVRCRLCSHYCILRDGETGKCFVRRNIEGSIYTLNWGKISGTAIDPIEKKPLYHYKPGSKVLSFGAPGCNFSCLNCQNWSLSQTPAISIDSLNQSQILSPENIIQELVEAKADGIAFTYSEPTIFFEYVLDIIKFTKKLNNRKDLFHIFVTNGFFSREILDFIIENELIQAMNVDLKFMSEKKYNDICGGHLKPVLINIKRIFNAGIHLELTNLLIPGENDSDYDISSLTEFVSDLSPKIPLHFSRFHPDFKMKGYEPTNIGRMLKAYEIARYAGLQYVYLGNVQVPHYEDTLCVKCGAILVERYGYRIANINIIDKEGPKCLYCNSDVSLIL
jgi:pyruvate formate lyase activating enzyme